MGKTMDEDYNLNNCPYCSSDDVNIDEDLEFDSDVHYYVSCYQCGASGPRMTTEEAAISSWNSVVSAEE